MLPASWLEAFRPLDIRTFACHGPFMREKELRLALVCYGGVSLAVYMHGITKEIWRLACASRAFHAGETTPPGSQSVYMRLLALMASECDLELRILVDILAGASAGGINAIFLAEAISSGRSLDPLTDLWLETADVDRLIDPEVNSVSRIAKGLAVPFAWALSARRNGNIAQTVERGHRGEIRTKVANFVRSRWFAPPFSGAGFTRLILGAFDAMARQPAGAALLPDYQPLDLFVTVTDFNGYPERLRLHSPPEVSEREHRVTLSFRDAGGDDRRLADTAELTFAARATASFPGAFPPFQVGELDKVLADQARPWPGREAFLRRVLPRHAAIGDLDSAVLIDGSVLANAPFQPAIAALQNRPTRREVDRRFVYIDPKPGVRSVRLTGEGAAEPPGFFATIFGAMSDIPREQPIRDNLEAIDRRSSRIRRLSLIVEGMQPEVEAAIERAFGSTLLLGRPTPNRLSGWRTKAQNIAAKQAGYAFAAYGHLKLSTVVDEVADTLARLAGGSDKGRRESVREAVSELVHEQGLADPGAMSSAGARPEVVLFLRKFDTAFRIRRLRFLARRLRDLEQQDDPPREAIHGLRRVIYDLIPLYAEAADRAPAGAPPLADMAELIAAPEAATERLADRLDLRAADEVADAQLSEALAAMPKRERRALILTYLGFPFYDIATLPLLQGEGLDEFDPVKVDRISPEDSTGIRPGGTMATLKGIQFNSFGAFFSRAYRENDYLWGRLHGAERLIDITVSALPEGAYLPPGAVSSLKHQAFRAILDEERGRLKSIAPLFESLDREIG